MITEVDERAHSLVGVQQIAETLKGLQVDDATLAIMDNPAFFKRTPLNHPPCEEIKMYHTKV